MVDKDGDSLQDMQMYSPSHWSKESGLHSLGSTVFVYLFICLFVYLGLKSFLPASFLRKSFLRTTTTFF